MSKFISRLRKDTRGAVTVDWIVMTVAMVGLGIVVLSSVSSEIMMPAPHTAHAAQ